MKGRGHRWQDMHVETRQHSPDSVLFLLLGYTDQLKSPDLLASKPLPAELSFIIWWPHMDYLVTGSKEFDIGLEKFVTSVYKEMLSDFPATADTISDAGTLADLSITFRSTTHR